MTTKRIWLACTLVSALAFGCGDDDGGNGPRIDGGGGTGGTTGGTGGGGRGGTGGGGTGGGGTGGGDAGADAGGEMDAGDEDTGAGNGDGNGERRVEIVATEFMFTPDQITATAGDTLIVTLVNMGSVDHTIEFEFDSGEVLLMPNVQPGQEGELTMQVPNEPGDHPFYCPINGHRALGMEGTITIEP